MKVRYHFLSCSPATENPLVCVCEIEHGNEKLLVNDKPWVTLTTEIDCYHHQRNRYYYKLLVK
jgi:hypothetical protein